MKEDAEKDKETGYIRNDSNYVSSTQIPASQQLEMRKEEREEGESNHKVEKGKAAAITTMTTSDTVITQHKQLAQDDDDDEAQQQQHEQKQLLSLTAAASTMLTTNTSYEECSRTTEAGNINGGATTPSLPLLCAQTSATSLRNENEKVAENVVGANFLVGNSNSVQETHENCDDTVPSNANSKEAKSSVLSPSQSSEKTAFDSSSSTSSGNWPHVNGALNMTIKSGIKGDDISSSIETIVQTTSCTTHDCNSSSDDNNSNASSPISDNEHSNLVSENEVTTQNDKHSMTATKNVSPETSHTVLSTKSSLSSGSSSSGSSNKDNDLNGLGRIVCKDTTNDDGMTGSGGEMEEDEDEDLEDGETPMNLSPALNEKMITEVIDNKNTSSSLNIHHNHEQQHLNNTNNRNGNSDSQIEAINLCKNNDQIHHSSQNISSSSSPPMKINTSSSIGLSAKMRLKKQRLAMEAAAAAASTSESDNIHQTQKVRPTSPSVVSNSAYQRKLDSLSSKAQKYPQNDLQSMDVVMNLSGRPPVHETSNHSRSVTSVPNHRTNIYSRWEHNRQIANDVDSSALHRLAEAAEWKQVRFSL